VFFCVHAFTSNVLCSFCVHVFTSNVLCSFCVHAFCVWIHRHVLALHLLPILSRCLCHVRPLLVHVIIITTTRASVCTLINPPCVPIDPSTQVVGIARFVRTSSSSPQLMALVPQPEKLNRDDGSQLQPPGFHALVLPFADDLRDLPLEPATTTTATAPGGAESLATSEGGGETNGKHTVSEAPQLVAAAEALVGAVTLEREAVMSIHNPVLQKQYHMLQVNAPVQIKRRP